MVSASLTKFSKHTVGRCNLPQALYDPLRQSFRSVVLPSVFYVGEIHEPSPLVIHDVEERPHRRHELLGEAVEGRGLWG